MQRADIWRLESAALQHHSEAVVRELESALGVTRNQARRIVQDELGEPIVVAAKAMSLPADVLQRMLLFINPRVGQSVDRVYELATLYGEISVGAAQRLIAIWREADQAADRQAGHEPPRLARGRRDRSASALRGRPPSRPGRRNRGRVPPAEAVSGHDLIEEVTTGTVLDLDDPDIGVEAQLAGETPRSSPRVPAAAPRTR